MTNYEKIKQMSIDELAKAMPCPFELDIAVKTSFKGDCELGIGRDVSDFSCLACCKRYLESEATSEAKQE